MEVLYERCSGLDVHQATVVACVRRPSSQRGQHAGENLEPEVLFIAEPIGAALEDTDLVVQPLDEPERDLVLWAAVGGDPLPVLRNHRGELLLIGP